MATQREFDYDQLPTQRVVVYVHRERRLVQHAPLFDVEHVGNDQRINVVSKTKQIRSYTCNLTAGLNWPEETVVSSLKIPLTLVIRQCCSTPSNPSHPSINPSFPPFPCLSYYYFNAGIGCFFRRPTTLSTCIFLYTTTSMRNSRDVSISDSTVKDLQLLWMVKLIFTRLDRFFSLSISNWQAAGRN